jgi:hypothetical protein
VTRVTTPDERAGLGTLTTIAPGSATSQTGSRGLGCQAFTSSSTWPVIRETAPDAHAVRVKANHHVIRAT